MNATNAVNVTNGGNGHSHLEVPPDYNLVRDILLIILYSFTTLFAIVANFFVCKIVLGNKKMQTKTNLLIVSMAVSDILAGAAIPGQWLFCSHALLHHTWAQIFCGIFKSLQIVTYFLSTLTMVTIAIIRYLAIFHKSHSIFGYQFRVNLRAAIASTWFIAIAFVACTAVSIKIFKYFTPNEIITCGVILEFTEPFDSKRVRKIRVASVLLAQFLFPLLITIALYARIMFVVFQRKLVGYETRDRSQKLSESKKRTIIMLVTVLIVFTVCWLPVHIHHLHNFFVKPKKTLKNYCNNSTSYFVMYWLSISSCCYNPIIYYIFDARFRSGFQNLIRRGRFDVTVEKNIEGVAARSDSKPTDTSDTNV